MEFAANQLNTSCLFFSLREGEECVASCKGDSCAYYSRRGEPYLLSFTVRDVLRCKGYGQRLLNFIIDYYRNAGAHRVTLEVHRENAIAIRVYEKLGFEYMLGSSGPLSSFGYYMVRYL